MIKIKKIFLLLVITLILIMNVSAKNRFAIDIEEDYLKNQNLEEEIEPIYINGKLKEFNIKIEIPEDCNQDKIVVKPDIFNGINNYKKIVPKEEIKINLIIKNNTNYNYVYQKNSLKISTELPTEYENIIGKGFDGKDIYDNYSIQRVYNNALKSLYNEQKYNENYLSDNMLEEKLKSIGYSLKEIDKYYLEYFNNKYNLHEDDLNNFTYSVIKEIFTGTIGDYKENNDEVISLAYNYYYNKLLYILPDNIKIDQYESDDYSIGEYMRNKKISKNFEIVTEKNNIYLNNIKIGLNDYYYTNIFDTYNPLGQIKLILEKED